MTRPEATTERPCPRCGGSEAPATARRNCYVCKGAGLVSEAVWDAWNRRVASHSTSMTIDIRGKFVATLTMLKRARTLQTGALIVVGEALLESFDSMRMVDPQKPTPPPKPEERDAMYARVHEWLAKADMVLDRKR